MRKGRWLQVRDGLTCCICGEPITDVKEVTKEHEPPLSRGGKKEQWDYAHRKCNNFKGALTMDEYKLFLELLNKRNGKTR